MEWTGDGFEWTHEDDTQWVGNPYEDPVVDTLPADPVYATGAMLNGEIVDMEEINTVTVYFRYRPEQIE